MPVFQVSQQFLIGSVAHISSPRDLRPVNIRVVVHPFVVEIVVHIVAHQHELPTGKALNIISQIADFGDPILVLSGGVSVTAAVAADTAMARPCSKASCRLSVI